MTGVKQQAVLSKSQPTQHAEGKEEKAMLNSKLQVTKRERFLLELIMLSPILIVFTVLHTTHSFVFTLFLFHVVLTVFPILFLRKKNIHIDWKGLLKQDLARYSRVLKNDVKLIAVPAVLLSGVYVAYRCVFPDYPYHNLRLPALSDKLAAIVLTIEFVILNPIVEEIFWRFFADLFTGRSKTVWNRLDLSIHFGLYHFFVAHYLSQDLVLSLMGCVGVATLGFILTYVKQKAGLITAMILHVGVDLAAAIIIVDMQSKFIPLY
jgi:membrane protease YdiL (CAAX protease family)